MAAALQQGGSAVAVGCLRNAQAAANGLTGDLEDGHSVAVVAPGERWGYDDSLRPALEDHLDSGAILSSMVAPAFVCSGGHSCPPHD
jgi:phosphosulfolactate phosphohydrolase-like enzyme